MARYCPIVSGQNNHSLEHPVLWPLAGPPSISANQGSLEVTKFQEHSSEELSPPFISHCQLSPSWSISERQVATGKVPLRSHGRTAGERAALPAGRLTPSFRSLPSYCAVLRVDGGGSRPARADQVTSDLWMCGAEGRVRSEGRRPTVLPVSIRHGSTKTRPVAQ